MILGTGCDILNIKKVDKMHRKMGWSLPHQVLGHNELEVFAGLGNGQETVYLARRYCAKEAFFKALGRKGDWRDVQVLNDADGRPTLAFSGSLKEEMYSDRMFHVTISDSEEVVISFVTMEAT